MAERRHSRPRCLRAAVRAGIALLFAAVALPAAAQWLSGPHALFKSRLNGGPTQTAHWH